MVIALAGLCVFGYVVYHTKEVRPSWGGEWTAILRPMLYLKYGWTLAIPLVISVIGILVSGFSNAGSYDGYTAGSVFDPDNYEDNPISLIHGSDIGISAQALNRHLDDLRAKNLLLVSLFLLLFVAVALLLVTLSWTMAATVGYMYDQMKSTEKLKNFMLSQYRRKFGKYDQTGLERSFPFKLCQFAVEYVLSQGWMKAMVKSDESGKSKQMWKDLAVAVTVPWGKPYLWFQGLKQDQYGCLISSSATEPTAGPENNGQTGAKSARQEHTVKSAPEKQTTTKRSASQQSKQAVFKPAQPTHVSNTSQASGPESVHMQNDISISSVSLPKRPQQNEQG